MEQIIFKEINKIKPLIEGKRFLLVRDKAYDCLDIRKFFSKIPHVEFSGFTSNPLYEQICKGIEIYNNRQCDMIVAVGGGSTIDVAKCIKLYSKMDSRINYLKQKITDSLPQIPLIAIPTTAGTGSESTCHAVIYFEGEKQSISHPCIIPDFVVLESSVLKTLPVYQKKCTMLDAFCQAVESWWSLNSNNKSREYSKKAITGIRDNWKEYITGNNIIAARKIMEASNYAGKAINITATTAAHAMSYKITSLYGFPHGHAVAVCMIEVWKYILEHIDKCIDTRGKDYLRNTLKEINSLAGYDWYCNLLEELDITNPVALKRNTELKILTQSINQTRLKNNPVLLNTEVMLEMYKRILR